MTLVAAIDCVEQPFELVEIEIKKLDTDALATIKIPKSYLVSFKLTQEMKRP